MNLQVITWVYFFLFNIRYRRPVPQVLHQNYGQSTLKSFRRLQNLHLRRAKSLCDLEFLQLCKLRNVFPRFLFFKSSIRNLRDSKLYVSILHKCLNFEINSKRKKYNRLDKEFNVNLQQYKSNVSWLDYKVSLSFITKDNSRKIDNVKATHNKKLASLGIYQSSELDADKVIFNFYDRILTNDEKQILKLGLQFGFSKKTSFVNHYLSYEKFIQQVSKHGNNNEELLTKIKHLSHESYKYKSKDNNKCNINIDILDSLKKDSNLIITRPDKGKGIVLLNKSDYIAKTKEILDDTSKFRKLDGDWFKIILKLEDKLNRLLRCIKSKLPESCFNFLSASGSLPGILYGLPKIHKQNCPVRPILAATGTFNYNCAKFLVPILTPLTTNDFTVKNSIEFANELKDFKFNESLFLASFDVKSLFTNIPLAETIDICVRECDRLNLVPYGLTSKEFRSLLELSVKESIFIFDDQLFLQLDGVAMGSPLGPTLANAFLCYHERKWLEDCPIEFKPIKFNRYVDDCFLAFKCKDHATKFLEYLNNQHSNIAFTSEFEEANSLPFLDILITKDNGSLNTNVFRKETYTGLGLNYDSFVPYLFKINSIKTLLHRAYNICSTWQNLHVELEKLKDYFCINSYPRDLVDKHIKRFISSKFNNTQTSDDDNKEIRYVTLPFQGHFSYQLRNSLTGLLKKYVPNVQYRFIFTNRNTIGSLFKFKDSIPTLLCSKVVYCFCCRDCKSRYLGSTFRNLKIRICEHKGVSYRTNAQITNPSFSKIREHALSCNHSFSEQDFSIKYRALCNSDLRIAESLLIMKEKPELNGNELATKLLIFT